MENKNSTIFKLTKTFLIIFTFLAIAGSSYCQTVSEWQSDLRSLQEIVHSKYNNLFYNITASQWDQAVEDLYIKIPSMDKYEILAGFVNLLSLFQVGHTHINTRALMDNQSDLKLHFYPVQFYKFSDGIYILRADKKYEEAVGGKVLKVGNLSIEEAVEAIRPLVNCENEFGFDAMSMYFFMIPEFLKAQGITGKEDEVTISYLKDDNEQTITLESEVRNPNLNSAGISTPDGWTDARKSGATPLWLKNPSSYRYMEYLPESKILYVRHSAVADDSLETIESYFNNVFDFIEKNDVDKFVLDVRMNGGGNNYLNKSVITGIIRTDKINKRGKFYCIIGRRTFSAAQNLVNELEKYTEVIFAGEPTAENVNFYGDIIQETLPNSKLQARLSWLWWQNFDPRDKRKATYPQLAVEMSFNDFRNNDDPVMNVILNHSGDEEIYSTLDRFTSQGKYEEAYEAAKNYLTNPLHRYTLTDVENRINNYGYSLLSKRKFNDANKIFEINIKLFPESANAYDSYAESFMELGQNSEAVRFYEIAISKDKGGATAENSRKMIEKITKSE